MSELITILLQFLQAPFTSECEHGGDPLALNNFNDIMMTFVLYNVGTDITATLVISVEADVTLLYVGYTDGAVHSLAAVSTCTCS